MESAGKYAAARPNASGKTGGRIPDGVATTLLGKSQAAGDRVAEAGFTSCGLLAVVSGLIFSRWCGDDDRSMETIEIG